MAEDYVMEMPEEGVDPETGEIVDHEQGSLIPMAYSLLIVDNMLVVNEQFETEVTIPVLNSLTWEPKQQPYIQGTYDGLYTFTWDTGKKKGSYDVHLFRYNGEHGEMHKVVPDWHSVTSRLSKKDVGRDVVLIYMGKLTQQNGRPYHHVLVARKK